MTLRRCLREPIPEIELAAMRLNEAVDAHRQGRFEDAEELLRNANDRTVWEWLDSVWGKATVYNTPRRVIADPPTLAKAFQSIPRDATAATKRQVHERDGHYCRFCGIPVVRRVIRSALHARYPKSVPWGDSNRTQHAAFQCCWAQYDHIVPHARGGRSDLENIVLACAACNYGRDSFLLEEFDLLHPDHIPKRVGDWDGLERFLLPTAVAA